MHRHQRALKILSEGTVIPATPLVLDNARSFDEKGQALLTRYYLEAGAGGIATAVHSTQFEIRDRQFNMFDKVLRVVSSEIEKYEKKSGKTIVKVSGVCGKIPQAVNEASKAKEYGYDAVLLSPNGLNDLTEDEMIERTKIISEIMPVIGFNLQNAVGGRTFSYNYWEKFCEIKNTVAIKCASFNRYSTLDVVRAAALSQRANEITLYTGNDDNIIVDLITKYKFALGGKTYEKSFKGGLLGHWSVWTNTAVALFDMIKNSEVNRDILTLAAEVTDANAAIFDVAHGFAGCIPGIHYVLNRQGLMKNTYCLNPNEVVSENQIDEIERVYKMYPHLNDDEFTKEFLKRNECV